MSARRVPAAKTTKDDGPPKKLRKLDTEKPKFGNEMVEVRVGTGEQAKIFHAHKDLLAQHSEFFKAAFKGNWKERAERAINLPEDKVDSFEHFHSFIYTGMLFTIRDGDRTREGNVEFDEELTRVCDAWELGNKLLSTPFKDALTDSLIAKGS